MIEKLLSYFKFDDEKQQYELIKNSNVIVLIRAERIVILIRIEYTVF